MEVKYKQYFTSFFMEQRQKPWGHETWFAQTQFYAGKILYIKKGHRYSLQYHQYKIEDQFVSFGRVKFTYGYDKDNLQEIILSAGESFHVEPMMIHRAEALEDSWIFEVSTPQLDDVVKLEDDYGRSGSGNNPELDNQLNSEIDGKNKTACPHSAESQSRNAHGNSSAQ